MSSILPTGTELENSSEICILIVYMVKSPFHSLTQSKTLPLLALGTFAAVAIIIAYLVNIYILYSVRGQG